jgi:hypothetical protein
VILPAKVPDGLKCWSLRFAILLTSVCLVACSRREGLNFDCAWVSDPLLQVDVHNEGHVQHVLADIRVAEELAMRYGDRMAGTRLVETFGIVSRHGGTKNRELGRQSRRECVGTLFRVIASRHGIAVKDIEGMRPRLADRGFYLPVTIPVALLLALAVRRFTRWIRNRFEPDEWAGWVVATMFASLIIPAIVLSIGAGLAIVVEIVRLGNEHVGDRVRVEGLRMHAIAALGIGMAAVWLGSGITALRTRAAVSPAPLVPRIDA